MGKSTGFLEYDRENNAAAEPKARIKHYQEFHLPLGEEEAGSAVYGLRGSVLPVGNDDEGDGFGMSVK